MATASSSSTTDHRLRRGAETRHRLMRAAEKLIAQKGLGQVSIRQILDAAEQNNASALQYHFGSLQGLIEAIHAERSEQTRAKRDELLREALENGQPMRLRSLCELMILPSFELARDDTGYRRYIRAFGHQLALIETGALQAARHNGAGGASGAELGRQLIAALPHLKEATLRQRMDFAIRLCASAMVNQAGLKNAFRGQQAEFFITGLVDALTGLLSGPASDPA